MKVDIKVVIRQMMAVHNVVVTEFKEPFDEIPQTPYFELRRLLNLNEDQGKEILVFIKNVKLNKVSIIEDFLGACHCVFLIPDSQEYIIIGPYRTETVKEKDYSKLGADTDQIFHLKEVLSLIPLVEKNVIQMSLLPVISTLFDKDKFDVHHLIEEAPHVFMPDKALFQSRQLNIQERMQMLEDRYFTENEILNAVASGNATKALEFMGRMGSRDVVMRFTDTLRSQKNSLIIFSSLMRKAIERAGVHPYYIDEISTRYSNMIEMVMDEREYFLMMKMMIREYSDYAVKYGKKQYSMMVEKVVALIGEDVSKSHTLHEVSEALNLNASYLSNLFKKETGMTLSSYVQNQKMKTAAEMLKTTHRSVSQIAESVGMMDVNYFCRVFKKQMGCTPGEYRRK